jgi:hypothetical protein
VLLAAAVLVFTADVAYLLAHRDSGDVPVGKAVVALPSEIAPPPPAPVEPPPTSPGSSAAGSNVSVDPPSPAAPPSADGPAPPTVTCKEDPGIDESPDAPYDFFCRAGEVPVTWAARELTLYVTGLDSLQSSALAIALAQWQTHTGFVITRRVNVPDGADITIEPAPLDTAEGGFTSVRYGCAAACAFEHADVQLASTLGLTDTLWVPIILHELGHVAGLSHVSRSSEVMFPVLGITSPVAYGTGDIAGLRALAAVRDG